MYDIVKNEIIDKNDNDLENSILYENIIKNENDINNQLEEHLKKYNNIYATIYLNKKELVNTDKEDVNNYMKMINELKLEKEYIDRYINNVDASFCVKDINDIKVNFIYDNDKYEPIFEYKNKNLINIECPKIIKNENDDSLKIIKNENDDSLKIIKNENDEFKCYFCQVIPKDKSIKTIILDNKNQSKTIFFCSFKCFENEYNAFKKYDK